VVPPYLFTEFKVFRLNYDCISKRDNKPLQLSEEKDEEPSGKDYFAFHVTLLKELARLWKMDLSKLFYEIDAVDKCHRDVATPHAVIIGQDFSDIKIYVDFTLILTNLTIVEAIAALVALHYTTNVHYDRNVYLLLELLQKQFCVLAPKQGSHKPGKENFAQQSNEIQAYQQFIGSYLYKQELSKRK
jgi:hypothetical protein